MAKASKIEASESAEQDCSADFFCVAAIRSLAVSLPYLKLLDATQQSDSW